MRYEGHFLQRLVAADRHDFMRRATGFGQTAAAGFAQAMRRASLGDTGLARLLGEPVVESGFGEGFAELRFEKHGLLCQRRHSRNRGFELGQKRNVDFGPGLFLAVDQPPANDVPRPQPDGIAAARGGAKQQLKRQPFARAYGVAIGEQFDFGIRPILEALHLVADRLDLGHWVDPDHLALLGELQNRAQHAPQIVRRRRCRRLLVEKGGDVLLFEPRHGMIAIIGAEPFQNAAIGLPRGIGKLDEGGRLVIDGDEIGNASGFDPAFAQLDFLPGHGRLIGRHEVRRPGQARQRHLFVPRPSQIPARLAPAIDIAVTVFRRLTH